MFSTYYILSKSRFTLVFFISSVFFCSGFWRDQPTPSNGFIQGLSDRLKTTVLSSQAYRTSFQYRRAIQRDEVHGLAWGEGRPRPPSQGKVLGNEVEFFRHFTALSTASVVIALLL